MASRKTRTPTRENKSRLTQPSAAAAQFALQQTQHKARNTQQSLQGIIDMLRRENTALDEQVQLCLAVEGLGPVAPIRTLKRDGGLPEATYVALASDWHMGERVRKNQVQGLNEYNPEIAAERAHKYFRSNLIMLQASRSAWNVNQLLLWLGGDLMTGYIHEEYLMENFLTPTEELLLCFETISAGLRFILAEYDVERVVIVTNQGNHGRGQQKKITADYRTSYEHLLYQLLRKAFEHEPRIQWQIGDGYLNTFELYGVTIDFHHGDEVMYAGGVGGIYVPLYRRIQRLGSGAIVDVSGHHHELGFAKGIAKNGSLIGPTPYGLNKGFKPEPAMQGSFIVDAKHKIPCAMNPIFVETRSDPARLRRASRSK